MVRYVKSYFNISLYTWVFEDRKFKEIPFYYKKASEYFWLALTGYVKLE